MNLSLETLQNSWDKNPDGAGFMYAEDEKLTIVKGLMTFEAFCAAYEPHKSKKCVLHFRIATHGGVNEQNTHPFQVTDTLGMVHNGILNNVKTPNAEWSDTWHFTEMYLKKYHYLWLDNEFKDLVESYIGSSKLILMDNLGKVEIFKEKSGYWDSNCWFSNKSYQTVVPVAPLPDVWKQKHKEPQYKGTTHSPKMQRGDIVLLDTTILFTDPKNPNIGQWIHKDAEVMVESFGARTTVNLVDVVTGYTAQSNIFNITQIQDTQLCLPTWKNESPWDMPNYTI
jgi:hypothetical protein